MELSRALRFDAYVNPPRAAFVGGGGKTTAMFTCAGQLNGPVLLTASTHLAIEQIRLADQHFYADDDHLASLAVDLPSGLTLITGSKERASNRTRGVSAAQMERINSLAEKHAVPLLIEADGARRLPLKAPADHEPPIPEFVDSVVVVAGLQGLGQPLAPQTVFRPEIFAALSGLLPGDPITTDALSHVLRHHQGGVKNIPRSARRLVLLNQADTPLLQAQGSSLAAELLPDFETVVISALEPAPHVYAVHEAIAAVILAAGAARRFGRPKQLLEWRSRPLVWHVAQRALKAGLHPVVIVGGVEIEAMRSALADLPVHLIYNPDWQQGQGASVRVGVGAVPAQSGGILFLLADQPQIPVTLIRKLMEVHAQSLRPITGPLIDGQRGNPVMFDRRTFDALAALSGEVGGRQLFARYPVDWVPWLDDRLRLDVDKQEDYQRLLELDL